MRAVRAENKDELEKEFVGICAFGETAEAILAANLAELAGPIGEIGGGGAAAAVKAPTDGPAAVRAVIHGRVETEGALDLEEFCGGELVALAPEKFGAPDNGVVDGAAQGLPAERGISAVKIGEGVGAEFVVAAGVGSAEVNVGGFAEVLVGAEVADDANVLAAAGSENTVRVAAE